MPFFVYVLSDPRAPLEPRYVGFTKDVKARLKVHLSTARTGHRNHRAHWMRSLMRNDVVPVLSIVSTHEQEAEAKSAEIALIAKLRGEGALLTNGTDGGEGLSMPTQEVREKVTATLRRLKLRPWNKGKPWSAETRNKMSATASARTVSPEARVIRMRANGGRALIDESGTVYMGANDAARRLGLYPGNVSRAARTGGVTGGHSFQYVKGRY